MDYAKGGPIDPAWTVELARYLATSGRVHRYVPTVVAQHTYSLQCDGLHEPGPCPVKDVEPMTYAQALAERDYGLR